MSGQKRRKPIQKRFPPPQESLRGIQHLGQLLQKLLMRFFRSLAVLLMAPLTLLKMMGSKVKQLKTRSRASRQSSPFSPKSSRGWRALPFVNRRLANAGFILPTIAILLLIMSLVVSSLLFRSSSRSMQVIAEREQQVIYNSATPAIDRAKAKLERLFQAIPPTTSDSYFTQELLQDNPYKLPDETRLDLNGDGTLDNAWSFKLDTNGDGKEETVAYSVLHQVIATAPDGKPIADRESSDSAKAKNLIVRSGPVEMQRVSSSTACQNIAAYQKLKTDLGWETVSTANDARAFQVTALVVDQNNANTSQVNRTVATLEMQQDRQRSKGNKWGVWFRNDLEIFPGPQFNWNGVMHTEGNLFVSTANTNFRAFLISSPFSCLYTRTNSEATMSGDQGGALVREDGTPIFMGQMISGTMRDNTFAGSSQFDVFGVNGPSKTVTLDSSNDSVKGAATPNQLALDPVILFTENRNQTRAGDVHNDATRDNLWKNGDIAKGDRIYNKSVKTPHSDDTYRADNRYGPKPNYTDPFPDTDEYSVIPFGGSKKNGDRIESGDYAEAEKYKKITLLDSDPEATNEFNALGLDGYWERRSWAEGLRVIVGQRLDLGNANGWEGNSDPLYPPGANAANGSTMNTRAHEMRQWKTLRDNLAAVQATAVYHSEAVDRDFPIACLATTAHPGTRTTISNSTTFNYINVNGVARLNPNFLTGNGTNGWEFSPPATTGATDANEATFEAAIAAGQPLGKALRNLARFAGELDGAFPPKQEPAGSAIVHPFPFLSMWGNFSNLTRVLNFLDTGTGYNALSLADKTTLQTAACTIGMLAYNLDNIQDLNYTSPNAADTISTTALTSLNTVLAGDLDGAGSRLAGQGLAPGATPDAYVTANGLSAANRLALQLMQLKEQVARDRRFGFINPRIPYTVTKLTSDFTFGDVTYNSAGAATYEMGSTLVPANKVKTIQLPFDPASNNFLGLGPIDSDIKERNFIRLVTSLGIQPSRPAEYPSLYYLFPLANHFHNGKLTAKALAASPVSQIYQTEDINGNGILDAGEDKNANGVIDRDDYVGQTYIFNHGDGDTNDDVNDKYAYQVLIDAVGNDDVEDGDGIGAIALQPRARGDWKVPYVVGTRGIENNIKDGTTDVAVSFLDKGIFNGREMMVVRVLDVDLDLLRRNPIGTQTWLPYSGIVYAFREDAVREDAIARPASSAWGSCNSGDKITNAGCIMNAVSATPKDPPNNPTTGVSPKSVDYYADPDRRPHGFRLRNGMDLRRIPQSSDPNIRLKGMSFVSDNPVYIRADNRGFNLHDDATPPNPDSPIEEFDELLNDNWTNFYTRKTLNTTVFATDKDSWRPTDIIADAVSVLSNSFVDGTIEEGIRRQNIGGSNTSYRTLNAPNTSDRPWLRENGAQSNAVNQASPIKINRDGFPLYGANVQYGKDGNGFMAFNTDKDTISVGSSARVNAIIASGSVPSRAQQAYGGLHNFPRFLEVWGANNLHIAGALYQLSFSSYGTGPFDQDSWEPGNVPVAAELIKYYGPPQRKWGYDVGLQYVPPSSFADRMRDRDKPRSEFYREMPIDDPYVLNLRCAKVGGTRIDAQVNPSSCPA